MFGHELGQLPSHCSPASTTPLPQTGVQSLSLSELQVPEPPPGQQLSPFTHAVTVLPFWHDAAHVPPPTSVRSWQPIGGHDIGHEESGSQVSPDSTTPLPQLAGQSTSRLASDVLQPGGQQPSAVVPLHAFCVVVHLKLQVAGDPEGVTTSQQFGPGAQELGHVEGGSHVSPAVVSMNPSPHPAQSESLPAVHPAGQHWSLPAVEHVFGAWLQTTLHVDALPVCVSVVQLF
jgi:hypothetical protein